MHVCVCVCACVCMCACVCACAGSIDGAQATGGAGSYSRSGLCPLTHPLTHAPTHSLTEACTHSRTHPRTHALAHAHTHSLTHSLTYSLAHTHTASQITTTQNRVLGNGLVTLINLPIRGHLVVARAVVRTLEMWVYCSGHMACLVGSLC